jgi:hypothetical protein
VSAPRTKLPRIVVALVGLLASGWIAAAPIDVVRRCAAAASTAASGVQALEAQCPELEDALAALRLDGILYDDEKHKLNAAELFDVAALAEHYAGSQRPGPDVAALPGILDALNRSQGEKLQSWWQSLKSWFKQWLAQSDSALASWLNHLLDRWSAHADVSEMYLRIITFGLTALVAIAAIIVIVRELKAAGIGRARRPPPATPSSAAGLEPQFDGSPAHATVADGLAELLRALVKRLLQTGRLKGERSLTHRELIARSEFASDEQRAVFADVAHGAESSFYGPRRHAPESFADVQRRGEALLVQLNDSTSPP